MTNLEIETFETRISRYKLSSLDNDPVTIKISSTSEFIKCSVIDGHIIVWIQQLVSSKQENKTSIWSVLANEYYQFPADKQGYLDTVIIGNDAYHVFARQLIEKEI